MTTQFQHGNGNGKGSSHSYRLNASDLVDKSHWPDKKRAFLAYAEKEGYRSCLEDATYQYNIYETVIPVNFSEAVQLDKVRDTRKDLFSKAHYDLILLCDNKFASMVRRHENAAPGDRPRLIWTDIVHRMEVADEPAN